MSGRCRRWMLLGVLIYMAIIGIAMWSKVSFAGLWLNTFVLFVGCCAIGGLLDMFLRLIKPRWLGRLAIGVMWAVWLAGLWGAGWGLAFYPGRPDAVTTSPGLICRALYQGDDSGGIDIEVTQYRPLFLGLEKAIGTMVLHDEASVAGPRSLEGCPPVIVQDQG